MKNFLVTTTSATALMMLASTAMADVTAGEIWQNWQDLGKASGQTYTPGNVARTDNTVTLTDLAIASTNKEAKITGTIPEVVFEEQGDGSVKITMSDEYDLKMESSGIDDKQNTSTITIGQGGMSLIASGTPDAISYVYKSDNVKVHAADFTVDGEPSDLNIDVTLKDLNAAYAVKPGDKMDVSSTLASSAVDFRFTGSEKAEEGGAKGATFDVTGTLKGLAGATTGLMNLGAAGGTSDLAQMLANGMTTQLSMTYDGVSFDVAATDANAAPSHFSWRTGAGKVDMAMDADKISYGTNNKDATVQAEIAGLPVSDLSGSIGETSFDILVPIAKSDTPQDFKMSMAIRALTVSESLWAMIDPQGTIPRDPANVILETKGKATPKVSLANAGGIDAIEAEGSPADINALDITDLEVTGGGATLKGTGSLTFDNSKPPTLGGVAPMPAGKINLTLDGANGLLGKLIALGLVDPSAAMTFGAVSAMVARPGKGDDSLVSEIEFTDKGIIANGMPLPMGP